MDLLDFFESKKFKYVSQGITPNQFSSDPNDFKPNEWQVDAWNEVYRACLQSDLGTLQRTRSGGIKISNENRYVWDIRHSSSGGILTVYMFGRLYVFRVGYFNIRKENPESLPPYMAFKMFKDKCKEEGIDLDSYAIDNGAEVKKEIPKPYIFIYKEYQNIKKTLYNVHHIDFHSSYPAGLINTHPEFDKVVRFFYNGRKDHPEYKAVLNYTIGMMQSLKVPTINARWAHLSRDAIKDNNRRIIEMIDRLCKNNDTIIGLNTDGIWYQGPIYHAADEGSDVGQWSNDHQDCQFRAKSDGAYEFIENGVYTPVVRGLTSYDRINMDRTKWNWGDIFKGKLLQFEFNPEVGLEIINESDKEKEYGSF